MDQADEHGTKNTFVMIKIDVKVPLLLLLLLLLVSSSLSQTSREVLWRSKMVTQTKIKRKIRVERQRGSGFPWKFLFY